MNNPTDEQIKEFWEWCGLEYRQEPRTVCGYPSQEYRWCFGSRKLERYPVLDLNNLFEYAVPKLHAWTIGSCPDGDVCAVAVLSEGIRGECCTKTPALALFWAIWEVIKGTK